MKPILRDDFFKACFLSNLTVSQDKKTAALTLSCCDPENNRYNSTIWVKTDNRFVQLTAMNQESSFIFDDDRTILFPAIREEQDKKRVEEGFPYSCFYRISLDGGEAVKAFEVPLRVMAIRKLKEGLYLLTAKTDANGEDTVGMDEAQLKAMVKTAKDNKDYEVFDEIPFWGNNRGFVNKLRTSLYLYDEKENSAVKITERYANVSSVTVDDEHIFYTADLYTARPSHRPDLYCYDLISGSTECLYQGKAYEIHDLLMRNKELILLATDTKRFGNNENPYYYHYNFDHGQIELLAAYEYATGSSVGSDCRYGSGEELIADHDDLLFVTTREDSSPVYCLNKENKISELIAVQGSVDAIAATEDKILFIGMLQQKLQEVYEFDKKTKEIRCLSDFNDELLKDRYVAVPEKLSVESEGETIYGWVLKPKDYDPEKSYPAILDIHGGPKTVYGEVYYHEMQVWANEGYFVFFCNPIGSDGRDNEFMDIRGKYGTCDYHNIMDFTDEVLKHYPAIDQKRVGVTGGSYGGFMTNWIIGHTDRFAAAASQRSIANWTSFYGVSDIGTTFGPDQQGGNIWENQDKLWWHSPLKYARNCTTPTLFIHSDEDYRCPMAEGLQMYTALVDLGIEARLVYFKGENHELSRSGKPLHRLRRLNEITDWMQSHLK